MYPNTRQEQESDEDSSNSSFWSDGEDQEEVEIQQEVWKDPLNGAVEHEQKEATAREEPDQISKSEGSEEQRSRDQSGDGCETKDRGEGDQSEEDLSGDDETKDEGEGEEDLSGDGCETKDSGEGDQSEEDLSGDEDETKVGGEEDLSGVEDESEGSSKEDEGSEDDGNEGGSCGDDEEPGSEDDEEEHCSETHRGSSKSSSWSGEEHSVDTEERGSVEDLLKQAPGRRADMNTESEDDPSWCDGGHQERDESVKGSSAEHVDRSSEARKSLHSSERLHSRDDSREMLDRAAASLTDVPADRSDGFCGVDKLGSEDKSPLDLSEDENQRANEASSHRFHSTSGDLRTSLDYKSDDDDDDGGGREGESEEYDGSEDHSDEEANSLDSVFWFDQGRQHKEEEEPVEDAPGDEKFVVSFQHDTCEEEQRDQYEGSEEESEDGDSHCSSFWSGRANGNISDTGEKMDLREVEGLCESVKEVSGEDPDIRCPDTFWSDDQDEKFEGAVVDEGLEEEVNLSTEEDGGEERCSSSLDSPAPSLMTSGYGTLLPEDQDHQKVTEHEEDVASPVEAMCCGSTPPGGGDEAQRAQIQAPDQLSSGEDIKFLDVESSRSVEQGGDLRAPEQGRAASSLDERLSQLQLSERLDSEVDQDHEAAAGDSDAEQHSLSAFESYVRALTRSRCDGDLRPKPKSFIRPVMVQARKKTDPVAKYFQYKQLWDLFKVPGEKDHRELRWAVKERMASQPPQTKPRGALAPNSFTAPTDKKRASLRWRVRTDLANGLVPEPHGF